MIKRVYLDNIRTFVNFEWSPDRLALLMGDNGTGKTALIDALRSVQSLILGDTSSQEAFPQGSRTRWDSPLRPKQTVELDVEGNGGLYKYRIAVEHHERDAGKNRIVEETLSFDGVPLVGFVSGVLQLHRDDGSLGPKLNAKWTRSGVGAIVPGSDNTRLTWFKDWLYKLWILKPDARAMRARVGGETDGGSDARDDWLDADMRNLSSWYLHVLPRRSRAVFQAIEALGHVLPGFTELHEREGWMYARFEHSGKTVSYRLDELSDGQRTLLALYLVRHILMAPGAAIVLDEGDNYVSLREIQPWLMEVLELASSDRGPQVWLVSHHPEVLNLLAPERGWLFRREGNEHTRVSRFRPAEGLDAAETVARGWEDG